ncbi:PRC-barrel domain-containing protein [Rhizobium sp. EC-SD404]|uniref:PRC-barrel domain-containing protein n=1 Tax=Rhizobium sp. EC-SD404 TaxID=2038389 RepID=UPI001258D981|nr:PRC-barrel domain-containing protein [Rhizobium sp. EC-SD404]VVT26172.1 putative PRC-barrel domain protein [Rhizobium sp. EC-SD404]
MKRTLLTSVALGAMFAGAAFTNPAITDSIVSPAAAQTEPAPGSDATTDEPAETMDDATDSMGEAADDAGDAASDAAEDAADTVDDATESDADIEDGDATSPVTTTGDTNDANSGTMDDADSTEEADDMLSDTDDTTTPDTDADAPMTDDSASMDAPSGEMFITMQEENEVSANTYVGQSLYNMEDESIGEITDLIFSDDGGARTAVVGVGGFLGIGQKDVGVNFDMITIEQQPDSSDVRLVIEATREDLENAPEFMDLDDQMAEQDVATPPATDTGGAMDPAPAPAPAPAQ